MIKHYFNFLVIAFLSAFTGLLKAESTTNSKCANHSSIHIYSESIAQPPINDTEAKRETSRAISAFSTVEESGNFTNAINANNLTQLPIGIRENKNSIEYGIVVTKARFTPEYALIDVYARVVTPQLGDSNSKKDLYFGAEGLKLSYTGSIIGEAKLSLLGDVSILFNKEWMLTLEGGNIAKENDGNTLNDKTFVTIDCDGIKELFLTGNIQISRNLLTPIDIATGRIIEGETITRGGKVIPNRVRGEFSIKTTDWNDLLAEVDLTPFAIKTQTQNPDKGHFWFAAHKVILDLSDRRNHPSTQFPLSYIEGGYLIAGEQSWRGLYVQDLTVNLPEEFKTSSNPKKPISFSAQNMLIDNYGVSGRFTAQNLFTTKEGITSDHNAWRYSLDQISIDLVASNLVGGALSGTIQFPTKDYSSDIAQASFGYTGIITEDDYLLSVSLKNNIKFDLWGAQAALEEGSTIELKVKDRQFFPKAILNGQLDIALNSASTDQTQANSSENKDLYIRGVKFQELTLQTIAPYVTVKYFGAEGEHRLANFPMSINDIVLVADGTRTDLGFGITVGLQDKGFSASGVVHIESEIANTNKHFTWEYKGFRVSKLVLNNVDIKVATISGELELIRKDPLYGNGFKAFLSAKIGGLSEKGGIGINVNAIFGYSTFRYWGFEGSVDGLNVPAGFININGFTGGAFYRMLPSPMQKAHDKPRALAFTPNESVGLALRAGVYGSIKSKSISNFMASFSISTNARGGIAQIGFMGEAYIMTNLTAVVPAPFQTLQNKFTQVAEKSSFATELTQHDKIKTYFSPKEVDDYYPTETIIPSTIYGKLAMNYDFNSSVFHATADVYVNTPGNIITGVGQKGRAGWAVIHLAKNEWYMHIGTPTDMIGLKMGIGSFSAQTGSYLMVGTNIPASPLPPQEVANILGLQLQDLDYMKNLNALGDGKGFAFGTHFKYDTGDMTALILYAHFKAGIGGDIMLKNYGQTACSNLDGKPIGINGWYANGQAYAYLQGELGIKIKLFMIQKKIPIITAATATLLQVKAPNPFWMRGYLAGQYNLLGGLVKGGYRFKLELGEECQMEQQKQVIEGVKIIADVTPANNEKEVNVFAIPQATFAMKVNEPIVVQEDDGEHIYKIIVDKFSIVDENGNEIAGKTEYEKTGDALNFISSEILPPNKTMKTVVEVSFMEQKNGIYEVVMADGKKTTEREERSFTTGTAPSSIPLSNIQYAYPVVEQENFYAKESSSGYIKLKRGQNYLFEESSWVTIAQFKDKEGKAIPVNFSYNVTNNEVQFTVPELEKTQSYTFSISAKAKTDKTENESKALTKSTNYDSGNNSITIQTESRKAQNTTQNGEIERLSFNFRTSRYNTLANKIEALRFNTSKGYISTGIVFLHNGTSSDEYFDRTELSGSAYTDNKPLIELTALMDDAFAAKFKKLIYDDYPVEEIALSRASNTENGVGIPPVKALPISNGYLTYLEQQKGNPILKNSFPYQYDLFRYYMADWYEIVCKAADKKISGVNSPKIAELVESSFGVIPTGKYNVNVKYILPGNKKIGSQKNIAYEIK